jgi:hypothetical protein
MFKQPGPLFKENGFRASSQELYSGISRMLGYRQFPEEPQGGPW